MKSNISKLKKKLWELCKELTRARWGNNCYTCGSFVQFPHTGHFISSSICSTELRYSLDNLRPQCYACNIHRSGNWLAFEERLIKENGKKWVENLKKLNQQTKGGLYGVTWFEKKIEEYEQLKNSLV